MTSFKLLGAALVFSALVATPASAWDPGNAQAADPTFSIYSGMHGDIYSRMHGDASGLSVRPHFGNHTTGVKRFRSR
jgi:hypothetical protein